MNKFCISCKKVVYPLEQVKSNDEIWHKTCFKCHSCNVTLSVNNYKSLGKVPYCNSHYPQPSKFTVVADNLEMQRVISNSKVVSDINYHAEFQKNKGSKISVTEDPLLNQQKETMRTISQSSYRGDANKKTLMEAHRSNILEAHSNGTVVQSRACTEPHKQTKQDKHLNIVTAVTTAQRYRPGSIDDYEPGKALPDVTLHTSKSTTFYKPAPSTNGVHSKVENQDTRSFKSTCLDSPDILIVANGNKDAISSSINGTAIDYPEDDPNIPSERFDEEVNSIPLSKNLNERGVCYRAIYSYDAGDKDEVSFIEGDVIIHGDPIDDGWMYGIVERTRCFGMLPSNYVELMDH